MRRIKRCKRFHWSKYIAGNRPLIGYQTCASSHACASSAQTFSHNQVPRPAEASGTSFRSRQRPAQEVNGYVWSMSSRAILEASWSASKPVSYSALHGCAPGHGGPLSPLPPLSITFIRTLHRWRETSTKPGGSFLFRSASKPTILLEPCCSFHTTMTRDARPPRVDVHSHFIPPAYHSALEQTGHARPDGMPAIPVRICSTVLHGIFASLTEVWLTLI